MSQAWMSRSSSLPDKPRRAEARLPPALTQKILGQHASLFPGAKDFRLFYDRCRVGIKSIAVTTRAGCNPFGHNGIASLADLVQVGLSSDFGGLGCSLRKRHILYLH